MGDAADLCEWRDEERHFDDTDWEPPCKTCRWLDSDAFGPCEDCEANGGIQDNWAPKPKS